MVWRERHATLLLRRHTLPTTTLPASLNPGLGTSAAYVPTMRAALAGRASTPARHAAWPTARNRLPRALLRTSHPPHLPTRLMDMSLARVALAVAAVAAYKVRLSANRYARRGRRGAARRGGWRLAPRPRHRPLSRVLGGGWAAAACLRAPRGPCAPQPRHCAVAA